MSAPTKPRMFTLTRSHRCDRCGAAAQISAVTTLGGLLLFCNHHSNEHAAAMLDAGYVLYDVNGDPFRTLS